MDNVKEHEISFRIDEGGQIWSLTVTNCPGKEGNCSIYVERGCVCSCEECAQGEHWGCGEYGGGISDIGPGCSIALAVGVCGLKEWIEALGTEIIAGSDEIKAKAVMAWEYADQPTVTITSVVTA